jgi:hypothetical protein
MSVLLRIHVILPADARVHFAPAAVDRIHVILPGAELARPARRGYGNLYGYGNY